MEGLDSAREPDQTDDQYLEQMVQLQGERLDQMLSTATFDRIVLRYEDFATDLVQTAETLGAWLGIEFDPHAVISDRDRMSHHMTTKTVAESVGRWQSELPSRHADRIWETLGSRLERFGYSPM